jgi:hypothetical protein
MERTESIVIQVAPAYENIKIKEMEKFGWNLHGRQEINAKGEAYSKPSYLDKSTYLIKIEVYNYVKLHFVRSLSLPNLDKIKEIENEYFSLHSPVFPRLVPGGRILLPLWYFLLWPFWLFYYFFIYKKKKAAAEAQLAEMIKKQQDILQKVALLL